MMENFLRLIKSILLYYSPQDLFNDKQEERGND